MAGACDTPSKVGFNSSAPYVRLVTFASADFLHMLANLFVHQHTSFAHGVPPLEVVALDEATLVFCKRLHRPTVGERCMMPPPESFDAADGVLNVRRRGGLAGEAALRLKKWNMSVNEANLEKEVLRAKQYERVLTFKLQWVHDELRKEITKTTPRPIVVVDTTSLVLSSECFHELASFPEDVVSSVEPYGSCQMETEKVTRASVSS